MDINQYIICITRQYISFPSALLAAFKIDQLMSVWIFSQGEHSTRRLNLQLLHNLKYTDHIISILQSAVNYFDIKYQLCEKTKYRLL